MGTRNDRGDMNTDQMNAAHLLAMADLLNGRPLKDLLQEAEYHVMQGQTAEAIGIYAAVYKSMRGIPLDLDVQQTIVDRLSQGPQFVGRRTLPVDRTLFFTLRIEAPWMKKALELPLDLRYPDILRAFRPLPRNHDLDARFDARDNTLERARKQNEERNKLEELVAKNIRAELARWIRAHDPVRGVYPENVIE